MNTPNTNQVSHAGLASFILSLAAGFFALFGWLMTSPNLPSTSSGKHDVGTKVGQAIGKGIVFYMGIIFAFMALTVAFIGVILALIKLFKSKSIGSVIIGLVTLALSGGLGYWSLIIFINGIKR